MKLTGVSYAVPARSGKLTTGELLKRLNGHSSSDTLQSLAFAPLEAVEPPSFADLSLVLEIGGDLRVGRGDLFGVLRGAEQPRQRPSGLVIAVRGHEPSRALRQETDADGDDRSPDELHTNGDHKGRSVHAVLGRVDDDRSDEETNGDEELKGRDDHAADLLGRALGLIHRHQTRDAPDPKTCKDTADREPGQIVAAGLECNPDEEQACVGERWGGEQSRDDAPM